MPDNDLQRVVGRLRKDARGLSKLTILWQHKRDRSGGTAEHCRRAAWDPERRLEVLRRRAPGHPH
ncbi:hypothetical protein [Roseomonas marmotae]|uniref:Transposase n=1 Tax=Roseomonas marmotae TaxID=2768161 RepID=A0ABS3KEY0_9PROT|nr:hypothetical protein [Roseomonas marmotae]MBO1075213.1 hypothetical protein [Roseomonas marmotae]QTI79680.1 hypothetical protein IAI58_02415 [Roseomonas marmotae]